MKGSAGLQALVGRVLNMRVPGKAFQTSLPSASDRQSSEQSCRTAHSARGHQQSAPQHQQQQQQQQQQQALKNSQRPESASNASASNQQQQQQSQQSSSSPGTGEGEQITGNSHTSSTAGPHQADFEKDGAESATGSSPPGPSSQQGVDQQTSNHDCNNHAPAGGSTATANVAADDRPDAWQQALRMSESAAAQQSKEDDGPGPQEGQHGASGATGGSQESQPTAANRLHQGPADTNHLSRNGPALQGSSPTADAAGSRDSIQEAGRSLPQDGPSSTEPQLSASSESALQLPKDFGINAKRDGSAHQGQSAADLDLPGPRHEQNGCPSQQTDDQCLHSSSNAQELAGSSSHASDSDNQGTANPALHGSDGQSQASSSYAEAAASDRSKSTGPSSRLNAADAQATADLQGNSAKHRLNRQGSILDQPAGAVKGLMLLHSR